jgi:cobaltochelatase CobS
MSNVNTVEKINFDEMVQMSVAQVFPEVFDNTATGRVMVRKHRHPDCVPSNPDYIPDAKTLRRVLAWWFSPMRQALGLWGETGTGKTEMLLYVADRLNEPVYMVKVHASLMPEDLEGSKELKASAKGIITADRLGLAAKAYAFGGLLILDEVDKSNAPLGCALHGLVEGKPWPIEQFSLVLNKHANCRVTGTANTNGAGGHERYHTSNRMDQALRSRFGWLQCGFPEPAHEMAILEKKFTKLPRLMRKECVHVANKLRDALLGEKRDGQVAEPINAVFSTRTLVNWCSYTMAFGPDALWGESLSFAFDGSVDPDCEQQVKDVIKLQLGDLLNKPVKEVVAHFGQVKP